MADTKISALTAATSLDGTEVLPVVQSTATKNASVSQINAGAITYLNASYTLTSTTAAQKLFNTTTNGTLTISQTGLYEFEGIFSITSMSATSGNAGIDIKGAGTATVSGCQLYVCGLDSTTPGTAAAFSGIVFAGTGTTGAAIVLASTGTAMGFMVRGMMKVTATGTIIPSIALTTAAAAVVGAGSWFRIKQVAPNAVYSVGAWS